MNIKTLENIKIGSLNVGGLLSNVPYVEGCLKNLDILVIQEHWLYPDSLSFLQSFNQDFTGWGRSCNELNLNSLWRRGKGGIAILWRKSLNISIERMEELGNDRIISIQIKTEDRRNLYIIGAYLPSSNLPISIYRTFVDDLEDVINQLDSRGSFIVLGDLNCHIGTFGGPRSLTEINERGKYLIHMMRRLSLISVNSQPFCTGPVETFYNQNGLIRTTVDHILVSEDYFASVKSCYVGDDNSRNLSFHRPIFCVLHVRLAKISKTPKPKAITAWKKICVPSIREDYQQMVATGLSNLNIDQSSLADLPSIEEALKATTSVLKLSAEQSIPKIMFRHYLKPFWKEGLKPFHDKCRQYRKLWISQGRPRDSENSFFKNYKLAKRDFRRELRRKAYEFESKEYERLENIFEIDNSAFQRLMSNKRKERGLQTNALKIDGKFINDPEELRVIWKDHYAKLFNPMPHPNFDDKFATYIESCVKKYETESQNATYDALDEDFTVEEVCAICVKLPNAKSTGPDGLAYEHIKYGGCAIMNTLTVVLNAIRCIEQIPKSLAVGDIISLFKTNKKIRHNKDHYRGITLLNVVGKIFERLILNRWMPFFGEKCFPNCLQYAYQKGKNCIDASLSLQEAILHNIENGSKVYSCFLDSTKAFDTVWISGLFYKMFNLGIQGKSWRLLRHWYNKLTSRVLLDGVASDEFPVRQGVRQGGVLSPWLFMIFNDDLPKIVSECNEDFWLSNISCNPIMVADDITLLSTRVQGLQEMLYAVERYSLKWRFEFNPAKTTVVTFGESTQTHNKIKRSREWTLYGVPIEEKRRWPHVGIELSGNFSSTERTIEACKKAKSVMACLINIGARPNALNPICGASLWRTVGIPSALYGCELWTNMSINEINSLERCQRFNAKRIQGLDQKTRSEAATGSLGLWSMEGQIDKAKLLYLGRLCRLSATLKAKQLFIVRLFSHLSDPTKQRLGFIPEIIRLLSKYNLIIYLTTYIDELFFPAKNTWKNIVFNEITNYEIEKWKNGMINKEELVFYQRIHTSLKPLHMWEVAKRHPSEKSSIVFLVNIICGNVPEIFNSWIRGDATSHCVFCNTQIWNINYHFIMSCTNFNNWRNNMWDEITDQLPVDLLARLHSLDDTDLYECIIGGLIPFLNVDITLIDKFNLIVLQHIRTLLTLPN